MPLEDLLNLVCRRVQGALFDLDYGAIEEGSLAAPFFTSHRSVRWLSGPGIEALILVLAETHLVGCHRPALSGPGLLRGSARPVGDEAGPGSSTADGSRDGYTRADAVFGLWTNSVGRTAAGGRAVAAWRRGRRASWSTPRSLPMWSPSGPPLIGVPRVPPVLCGARWRLDRGDVCPAREALSPGRGVWG
jgi:hypothetical protein